MLKWRRVDAQVGDILNVSISTCGILSCQNGSSDFLRFDGCLEAGLHR